MGGGLLDTASDFFGNFRSAEDILTMPDVGFSYVYNNAYGIGFGAPFLLPTYNPTCSYRCGANDFLGVVNDYGLSNGVVSKSPKLKHLNMRSYREVDMDREVRRRFRVLETRPN